ncbi:hypothetical protein [Microlunatus ginsengisoli]|uniref:hypothetical protein n=1 Tax=Microlunatus ginsengisoli TaxID=363863 RepID=UPI0031D8C74F
MPTEPVAGAPEPEVTSRRRLVVVLARHVAAAPDRVDPAAFAAAALADSYEVAADLVDVDATIAGPASAAELLYPGARLLPADAPLAELVAVAAESGYAEVVFLPGDAPDLPGLVVAKLFKALNRAAVAVAPERGGTGCVALGVALPLAEWAELPADLDTDPRPSLYRAAPRRSKVASTPDWHRLRSAEDVLTRLDPALEGWEETRLLLSSRR